MNISYLLAPTIIFTTKIDNEAFLQGIAIERQSLMRGETTVNREIFYIYMDIIMAKSLQPAIVESEFIEIFLHVCTFFKTQKLSPGYLITLNKFYEEHANIKTTNSKYLFYKFLISYVELTLCSIFSFNNANIGTQFGSKNIDVFSKGVFENRPSFEILVRTKQVLLFFYFNLIKLTTSCYPCVCQSNKTKLLFKIANAYVYQTVEFTETDVKEMHKIIEHEQIQVERLFNECDVLNMIKNIH